MRHLWLLRTGLFVLLGAGGAQAASYLDNFGTVHNPIKRTDGFDSAYSGVNLEPGANLSSADLSDFVNLTGANLTNANLSFANLSNARLIQANLHHADVYYANLSNADLSNANLSYAGLYDSNLTNATLSYGANLSHANLSRADLTEADLTDSDLSYANLSHADLSYTILQTTDLSNANLSNAVVANADLSSANFNGALLFGVDFSTVIAFEWATWTGAKYSLNAKDNNGNPIPDTIFPDGSTASSGASWPLVNNMVAVPEPTAALLLGLGLVGLAVRRRGVERAA